MHMHITKSCIAFLLVVSDLFQIALLHYKGDHPIYLRYFLHLRGILDLNSGYIPLQARVLESANVLYRSNEERAYL